MTPEVAVVVPSFRQGQFLDRCLASIFGQEEVAIEVVVMDSESDDETSEVLKRWAPRIDRLVIERDDGQADAIARGFRLTTAPTMTWLNADDCYATATALACLHRHLEARPDIDLAYGRRLWIDGSGRFLRTFPYQPFDAEALRRACYLPQESALFRRSAYERCGGVDPEMRFAMDYDLWLRMLDDGSRFESLDEVIGLFRVHDDQKSIAWWSDVGLPEIAKLHRRHLREEVPETLMYVAADTHRLGLPPNSTAVDIRRGYELVELMASRTRALAGDEPIDRWPERRGAALCP